MTQLRHTILKMRTVPLVSGLVLAGVVVATAAIPWLRAPAAPDKAASSTAFQAHVEDRIASIAETAKAPPQSDTPSSPARSAQDRASIDESLRQRLSGVWQLEKHGQRVLAIRPDGTATAQVRLDLLGAWLYGEELTLNLTWTLESGIMTQTLTGGEPADAVARLIRDWGVERRYRIINVNARQLILAEVDDDNDREVWTAVTTPAGQDTGSANSVNEQSPR